MGKAGFLRVIEVLQQTAQSQRRRLFVFQAFRFFCPELPRHVGQRPFRRENVVSALLAGFHMAVKFFPDCLRQFRTRQRARIQHRFGGGKTSQFIDEMFLQVRTGKGGHMDFSSGQIAERRPRRPGPVFRRRSALCVLCVLCVRTVRQRRVQIQPAEEIPRPVIQRRGVHHRAGSYHAQNIPLDKPPGRRRVLHLLTNGDFVPLVNQTGNVGVTGMVGNAAHGNLFPARFRLFPVVPAGEG